MTLKVCVRSREIFWRVELLGENASPILMMSITRDENPERYHVTVLIFIKFKRIPMRNEERINLKNDTMIIRLIEH